MSAVVFFVIQFKKNKYKMGGGVVLCVKEDKIFGRKVFCTRETNADRQSSRAHIGRFPSFLESRRKPLLRNYAFSSSRLKCQSSSLIQSNQSTSQQHCCPHRAHTCFASRTPRALGLERGVWRAMEVDPSASRCCTRLAFGT